jgi:uncharacterized protein (TIGR02001 family)
MKNQNFRLGAAIVVGLVSAAAARQACAEDGLSGQIGVASEYIGKGLGKSDGEPAVSGSVEYSRSGFYSNLFASTAKLSQGSDAEIVTSVGYRTEAAGIGLDFSVNNRDLPGTRKGIDANYTEYQVDASRKFGAVSTRFRVNYTADGFSGTQEAWWVELQGAVALDGKTRASAAVADRSADGGAEYVAWNLGVKRKLNDAFALDARWYDTDGHDYGESYEGRFVAALTYAF